MATSLAAQIRKGFEAATALSGVQSELVALAHKTTNEPSASETAYS